MQARHYLLPQWMKHKNKHILIWPWKAYREISHSVSFRFSFVWMMGCEIDYQKKSHALSFRLVRFCLSFEPKSILRKHLWSLWIVSIAICGVAIKILWVRFVNHIHLRSQHTVEPLVLCRVSLINYANTHVICSDADRQATFACVCLLTLMIVTFLVI